MTGIHVPGVNHEPPADHQWTQEEVDRDNRNRAEQPRYKALIDLAGKQRLGVCIELSTGRVLRGVVYDSDARADWVRLFTFDVPNGRGPTWINQDQIVSMWWAPEVLPFDQQMHAEDGGAPPYGSDDDEDVATRG